MLAPHSATQAFMQIANNDSNVVYGVMCFCLCSSVSIANSSGGTILLGERVYACVLGVYGVVRV